MRFFKLFFRQLRTTVRSAPVLAALFCVGLLLGCAFPFWAQWQCLTQFFPLDTYNQRLTVRLDPPCPRASLAALEQRLQQSGALDYYVLTHDFAPAARRPETASGYDAYGNPLRPIERVSAVWLSDAPDRNNPFATTRALYGAMADTGDHMPAVGTVYFGYGQMVDGDAHTLPQAGDEVVLGGAPYRYQCTLSSERFDAVIAFADFARCDDVSEVACAFSPLTSRRRLVAWGESFRAAAPAARITIEHVSVWKQALTLLPSAARWALFGALCFLTDLLLLAGLLEQQKTSFAVWRMLGCRRRWLIGMVTGELLLAVGVAYGLVCGVFALYGAVARLGRRAFAIGCLVALPWLLWLIGAYLLIGIAAVTRILRCAPIARRGAE